MKSFLKILILGISIILCFPIKSMTFEVVVFPEKNNSVDILPSNNIPYDKYRNQLTSSGWIPSKSENIIDKRYPEVACGSTFCSAKFIAPSGTKILTFLLSGSNGRLEFVSGSEDLNDINSNNCY